MKVPVSKVLFSFVSAIFFVLLLSAQVFAVAPIEKNSNKNLENNGVIKKEAAAEKVLAKVCEKIESTFSKLSERSSVLESKMETRREEKMNAYTKRIEERSGEISEKRSAVDENFEAQITKMLAGATTEEEKAAVEKFKTTVENARKVRRTAVDTAHNTFRNEVKNQIQNREQNLEGLINNFKSAVSAAFETAKDSCANGDDIKDIRESFRASLKTAHEKFQNEKKNQERIGEVVSQATQVRKAAVEKANEAFKTSLQLAITNLKTVLEKTE